MAVQKIGSQNGKDGGYYFKTNYVLLFYPGLHGLQPAGKLARQQRGALSTLRAAQAHRCTCAPSWLTYASSQCVASNPSSAGNSPGGCCLPTWFRIPEGLRMSRAARCFWV